MEWYAYAMVALIAISTLATILTIGKPKVPTTPGMAVAVLVTNGLLIWGILALASG
jgi:hypothetical protein